jgi:hypothetical protein
MKLQAVDLQQLIAEQKRISSQISVGVEIITPELAKKFLEKNMLNKKHARNRKPHAKTINNYANDMINGRWRVGAPFIFDTTDCMIDGQQRCYAIIKANTAILSLVVNGVDPEIFDSLDCGKKRTPKNVMEMIFKNGKKLKKPSGVSAGISIMRSIARNHKAIDKNRGLLTNPELFELVYNDFDYYNEPFESDKISNWRKGINLAIGESILAGFYYTNKKKYSKLVDEFLTTITSNNSNTPPIVREFRDMMIFNKGKKSDERGYIAPYQIYLLINTLFKYSQEKRDLATRKHISKTDLQEIFNS